MGDAAENWYDSDVATFGDRLAAARDAAGLSQPGLAERLGVKLATIRKWEEDLAEPRANRLSMMSGLLGVSMTWLITGEGDGVDGPDAGTLDGDKQAVLNELRELRKSLVAKTEQLASLENRVAKLMQDAPLG